MVLDYIEAALREVRESTYTARRKAREAGYVVKSNPHYSRDLIGEADESMSRALDDMARIEQLIKTSLEPLLQRADHVETEERTADLLLRLDEMERRLRALERGNDEPPLRAVR